MQWEVEQKFRVDRLDTIRQRLMELGATFDPPIEQADTYFSHPARNFAQTDEALRLRRVGDQNRITYKGPRIDRETKTRRELELPPWTTTRNCLWRSALARSPPSSSAAKSRI